MVGEKMNCENCGKEFDGRNVNVNLKKNTEHKYVGWCKECIEKAEGTFKADTTIEDLCKTVRVDAITPSASYFIIKGNYEKEYMVSVSCGKWWCDCYNFVMSKNTDCKHIKACKLWVERNKK